MLKLVLVKKRCFYNPPAAFGRLCVETPIAKIGMLFLSSQPPSGGCVLKPCTSNALHTKPNPAAFGRLCVETKMVSAVKLKRLNQPPSGGCVLKLSLY